MVRILLAVEMVVCLLAGCSSSEEVAEGGTPNWQAEAKKDPNRNADGEK